MDRESLGGFRVGERVIVRQSSWGRTSRRGVVLGAGDCGAVAVRLERETAPAAMPLTSLFHDTPSFYAWLDMEIPPSGAAPAPAFGRRRAAREALLTDNPHLAIV